MTSDTEIVKGYVLSPPHGNRIILRKKNVMNDDEMFKTYMKFKIGKFQFNWFWDWGDWFMYFNWYMKDGHMKGFRFSSAGYLTYNTKEEST